MRRAKIRTNEVAKLTPTVDRRIEERGSAGRVAWLTIDNRAKLNAVNSALVEQLRAAAAGLADDDGLRAVVLTGAGDRAFVGGADIDELAENTPETARRYITALHQANAALRALPVPVIGRINGYCLGAGLEIAASCDFRVAATNARFGMPEVRVGLPSVIEAALLPGLIGWGKTNELLLTGEMIGAEEALACGLVERVVAAEALDQAVETWLDAILAAGRRAVRQQKALIRAWQSLPLEDAVVAGIDYLADAYTTDEPSRMLREFVNRRRR